MDPEPVLRNLAHAILDEGVGRLDPGPAHRRERIITLACAMAGIFLLLAWVHNAVVSVALIFTMGIVSGYSSLLYADVRSSYPPQTTGRALSIYTMAMFLGAAVMQWLSGVVAGFAEQQGQEIYPYVNSTVAVLLLLGCFAFWRIPKSPLLSNSKSQA